MNSSLNLHKIIQLVLVATMVVSIVFVVAPTITNAFGGDTGTGDSTECCDEGASDPTPDRPDRPDRPDEPDKPNATCTLSATATTINNGESTDITVTSSATSATLYKIDGYRYTFFGLIRVPNLVQIGNMPIGTPYTINPSSTTKYQVKVKKARHTQGICRINITVTNTPPVTNAPTCSITASPNSVLYGGSSTLSWSSTNTTIASIDNSIGTVGTIGSYGIANLITDKTYTMTVTGPGGTSTCSAAVDVQSIVHTYPTCSVWVSPSSVSYNEDTTLHWSSTNATSMYIPSIGTLPPNASGSRKFYNLTSDRAFECTAYNDNGDRDTDTAYVSVGGYNYDPPTCSLFASPITITRGGDSTLSWTTSNATSATLTDMGSAALNGSRVIYNLNDSKTYTLTAYGRGGTTTCTRTINVYDPYIPPIVPPTTVQPTCQIYPVYINRDITASGGGAILHWTAQNAASATLTDHGLVNNIVGTQFVKPTASKTYTLTVFNDNYRATCSTHITVAQHIITEYTPTGYVTLTGVPYTGAEDYIYLALLFVILLTVSFGIFFYRDKLWLLNLLTKRD